jgi:CRP-like cAMP-binding protein
LPRDFFGEIALLRDVPRTATVSTATPSHALHDSRIDFLSAVLGSCESADVVEQIVSSRISASTEQLAAVP